MSTDRNLLFGVLALQADLIDAGAFVEACTIWTTRKHTSMADLLVERGWLLPADRSHLDYLLERKLARHGGDARASLATVGDDIKRSLAALGDAEIQQSLAGLPATLDPCAHPTVDYVPFRGERYQLTRLHATGGIGRVWLARDGDLGRDVAFKELRPERADNAGLWKRFLQEARITGQLEHPGIVPVYELGTRPDNQPFYTMRFVKGRTLSEAARAYHQKRAAGQADSLDLPALLSAFVTVCNTIAYAHARGVIHRDLKGQNVLLGDFGEVVVLDWGLAKLLPSSPVPHSPDAGESDGGKGKEETPVVPVLLDAGGEDSGQTAHGQALGTPAYMAPEQAAGRLELIDRRTDVYGLGAILYEILTGQPPFSGPNTQEVLRKVQEEEPVPPSRLVAEVPPALEAICLRALAKQPSDRPAAAADLAHEVQGWQEFERRKAEEALRESEALYHSLVESLPCVVVRKDLEGRFTFANHRFLDLAGRKLEGLLGKTDFDIDNPPELAEKYKRDDLKVIETGRVFEDIEEVIFQDCRHYYHTLKSPIRDGAGKITGVQVIAWDVTARKHAEEELRKSQERFELAVLGSQDGLWDWDLATDEVYYSPRYKAMLGYEDHESPTQSEEWAERLHPDDRERVRDALRAEAEGRESLSWLEFRMRHKDGSYRWIRSRAYILRDAAGRMYRKAGSYEDITERKNAEDELARERHLLRSFIDSLPEGIYFKDRDGRFIRVNRTVAEPLGCAPAQLVGKTDFDFFAPEHARQSFEDEQEIIRTGRPVVGKEERVTWPDGTTLWVSTTKLPLRDPDGQIIGTFGITRDITNRKLAEETLRANEERYRSIIAAMQDGIIILNTDGSITSCNVAAERILGLSAEQIMGRTPHDPRWQSVLEDGSPTPSDTNPAMVTLRTGRPCTDVIMGVHKPDGTLTWITVNAQPLFQEDNKTLAGVVASFEDISERKRIEEQLRQITAELAMYRQQSPYPRD
jgi:eukaryotic-like serine/threonine-protein kinase